MAETVTNALPAAVVCLNLAGFGARPVAEQAQLKERLAAALAVAIAPLDAADRIVLEAPDGAAVVLLGDPGSALDLARDTRRAAPELPLAIGINHGPVRLAVGASPGLALVGDGLSAAGSVAGFAGEGRTLASRSFRDAVEATTPDCAEGLRPAGSFTDAGVRSHEVFTTDARAPASRRRRLVVLGVAGATGLIAAGLFVRRRRHVAMARARQPAIVALAITPWGEILVDGVSRGRTPPLDSIQVNPGRHAIEVRNGANAPLKLDVDLAPGESLTLNHAFPRPQPPTAAARPPAAAKAATPAARPQQPAERSPVEDVGRGISRAGRSIQDFFRRLGQ